MTQTRRSWFGTVGGALLGVLAAVYVPSVVVAEFGGRRTVEEFTCAETGAYATWSERLTCEEVKLLHKGVSPLFVRPAALQFYAPMFGGLDFTLQFGGKDVAEVLMQWDGERHASP